MAILGIVDVAADYYATLGVDRGADDAAIRRAYRNLMRCTHPDVNTAEDAGALASAINEAYACLHDPVKRAAYDGARRGGRPRRGATAPLRPMSEYQPNWGTLHVDQINEEQVILKRWKVISLGLAAIVTVITFTMTSSVDTSGVAPAGPHGTPAP